MLQITPAERRALQLLARGKSLHEVAVILEVSACVVATRLRVLFAGMGVSETAEAVENARRRGLLFTNEGQEGEGSDDGSADSGVSL